MPKSILGKEKWTLTFEPRLKEVVIREARKNGLYPVALLEQLVREKYNPFGHAAIRSGAAYVRSMRRSSRRRSDTQFLQEIREWQKSGS